LAAVRVGRGVTTVSVVSFFGGAPGITLEDLASVSAKRLRAVL
jgi:hypothetical protein